MDLLGQLISDSADRWPGQTLGDYQVVEFIAEGGMGRVYRGRRVDGSFDREVAIKISAIGTLSASMRERFEREQTVLAGLNHPHITQLYDAGITDDGSPYIVMELVQGLTFTEYCVQNDLSIGKRVELAIHVVEAVAFAHSRLVVHRDIKPTNILVDGDGQVKLLDFGIAKLLQPGATELTQSRPMTPRYAAPEQLLGQDVTVASDIFQLGLLLFEAVAQHPLHEDKTISEAIALAAERVPTILDSKSRSQLTPELALIVEQCLRVTPADRYLDANSLKADLQRYQDGYPVQAAGQSPAYRLRKWVGRNRVLAIGGALAMLALLSSATWYTYHLRIARNQAETEASAAALQASKSEKISQFLVELLGAAKPSNDLGQGLSVRQLLEQGVAKVREELSDQPALQASLLETMGDVFTDLADFEQAQLVLTEALTIRRSNENPDPLALASVLGELSQLSRAMGDYQTSLAFIEQALVGLRDNPSIEASKREAELRNTAGFAASKANQFELAAEHYRQSLALRREIYGPDHIQTSQTLSNYGTLLFKQGKLNQSLPMLRKALHIADENLGPYHPVISTRAINLANNLGSLRRWSEGEPLLRRAVEIDLQLYGENHHYVASSMLSLAGNQWRQGNAKEAAVLMEKALGIEMQSLGPRHKDTANTRYRLATVLTELHRLDEAQEHLQFARSIFDEHIKGDHMYRAEWAIAAARLAVAQSQTVKAQDHYGFAAAMLGRLFDPGHPKRLVALTESAALYEQTAQFDEALATQRQAIEGLLLRYDSEADEMQPHYETLARLQKKSGQVTAVENAPANGEKSVLR